MQLRPLLLIAAITASSVVEAGIREDWQTVADAVAATGNVDAAIKIEESVAKLSDDELEKVYGSVDLIQLADSFTATGEALIDLDEHLVEGQATTAIIFSSAGFPNADYPSTPLCPLIPGRSDGAASTAALVGIRTAKEALEVAEGVWSVASRGCDEVIVILGAGGNVSLACIPVDVVLFAAELAVGIAEDVFDTFQFCDGLVDSAEIEGSYERLAHVHEDLVDLTELLRVTMSRQLETMRLLITNDFQRTINPAVLNCTGSNCPQVAADVIVCELNGLSWPCKYSYPLFGP